MKADIHTIEAKTAGSIELADHIFGLEPRTDLIHRVIQWQLNKRQQGTHQAKSRGEISRTTKKLGPQKGSGGARHGSRKSGIFVGGGKAFGPRSRSHETSLNKKIRALGLRHAISAKVKDQSLVILDQAASDGKTKTLVAHLAKLNLNKALFIDGDAVNVSFAKASANIVGVNLLPAVGANVYDILKADSLVLTRAAVEKLEARFNG